MTIPELLRVLWPLLLLQLGLAIAAVVDLARRKRVRYLPKAAWVLICVFVNTLGPMVYFLIGRGDE